MILFAYSAESLALLVLGLLVCGIASVLLVVGLSTAVAHKLTGGKSKTLSCVLGLLLISFIGSLGNRSKPAAVSMRDLAVTPPAAKVAVGVSQHYLLQGTDNLGRSVFAEKLAAWSSSNPSVTFPQPGVALGSKPCTATISATYKGITARTQLTVTDQKLKTLEMPAQATDLARGITQRMLLLGHWSDGSKTQIATIATWTSSDPEVVSIQNEAWIHTGKPGTAKITATYLGQSASLEMRVLP